MNKFITENKDKIFKKYSKEELIKDIESFSEKGRLQKFLNHFFEEEMFKCRGGRGSLSPMEVLEDDLLIDKIITFCNSKPKFYTGNDIANVKSFFRNAGRIAQKVANFPTKEAKNIYEMYSAAGANVYDPSCGFGSRMSACLLSGRNYFGTDPNKTLCPKLIEAGKFIIDNINKTNLFVPMIEYKVYKQGSEIFIDELENKIDLCFTSPPYFDLEKYNDDPEQSNVKFGNYELWKTQFINKTVDNCIRYTKSGGYILFNIKDMTSGKKHPLFTDLITYMRTKSELEYVETLDIKQLSKRDYKGKHFTGVKTDFGAKEPVMVFKKK